MKRSRGRGRRPQNNHNRSFDSAGPDVKIRGTAAHVYEKYLQLARDASSAGDRVTAENYLQHAEHYFRILMASQAHQQQQQQQYGGGQQHQNGGEQRQNGGEPYHHHQQHQQHQQQQQHHHNIQGSTPSFSLADDGDDDEGDEAA